MFFLVERDCDGNSISKFSTLEELEAELQQYAQGYNGAARIARMLVIEGVEHRVSMIETRTFAFEIKVAT